MSQKKRMAVYIGRFSPVHNGHMTVISKAMQYDKVLIIIGSSYQARTSKNPWTSAERKDMLTAAITDKFGSSDKVSFAFAHDHHDDGHWLNEINTFIIQHQYEGSEEVYKPVYEPVLMGSDRDESTFYLSRFFPHLKKDLIPPDEALNISATLIRTAIFDHAAPPKDLLPPSTVSYLTSFLKTPEYKVLRDEYDYFEAYRSSWKPKKQGGHVPYAVNFVTADSVVTQAGHVLLIQRRSAPGKGLWALPGGFVETNERILDAALRELREETRLKVPEAVLRGSIVAQNYFDNPSRSLRGRTITHAFHFKLKDSDELAAVKPNSDAKRAEWVLMSKLPGMRAYMFEDHFSIIDNLTGGLPKSI